MIAGAESALCRRVSISAIMAEKSEESETPARMSRAESMPLPRRARTATKSAVPMPAANPRAGNAAAATPAAMPATIATAAPALTPVKNGSTSGFRSIPCSSAPAIPSDAPTVAPMTTRGSRSCHTMIAASPPCGCWSARTTCAGASHVPPASNAPSNAASVSAAKPARRAIMLLRRNLHHERTPGHRIAGNRRIPLVSDVEPAQRHERGISGAHSQIRVRALRIRPADRTPAATYRRLPR